MYHGAIWHRLPAHEQGNADDALIAHHGDLGGGAVGHDVEQGDNGGDGEIHVLQLITGLVENITEGQGDELQMGIEALGLGVGQGGQEMVVARAMMCGHRQTPVLKAQSYDRGDTAPCNGKFLDSV